MRNAVIIGTLALLCGVLYSPVVHATPLAVALDIQGQGISVASGGVGLIGLAASANIAVNIGGPVQAALLYWAGRDRPCPEVGGVCVVPSQPYKDQVLRLDGNLITGTIIGTESQPVSPGGPINNIGYLADVTSIVQAKGTGQQTFAIADGDINSNLFRLEGATLLVIYTNPADATTYRLILYHGLDFAFGADPTAGAPRVTVPIVFNHGAAAVSRQAQLLVIAGGGTAAGSDRIDIANNPSVVNGLDASSGDAWDDDTASITIPAGVSSTTVQVVSGPGGDGGIDEGCGPGFWKNHTDAWTPTGFSPAQTVGSVFSAAAAFPSLAGPTLLETLQGGGGGGALGGAKILLRAAVAALLDASHPNVNYPRTIVGVVADVNAALASHDRGTMLTLAAELDADNNLECSTEGNGGTADSLLWQAAVLRIPLN